MESAVRGLLDLHSWDPSTEGRGQYGYDAVMSAGPGILPSLVAHLADETPVRALYERTFEIQVTMGDVCFYLLLKLTDLPWREFLDDGAFISTQLPNPIFCIRWTDGIASRRKVQLHFLKILPPPE